MRCTCTKCSWVRWSRQSPGTPVVSIGVLRFLDKLYVVATRPHTDAAPPEDALRALHRTIAMADADVTKHLEGKQPARVI